MTYVYQEACGIWWETKFVPLMASIVNLTVNIILVKIIGLPGILISTIVSVIFIYDMGYAKVLFKTYFKPIPDGLKKHWKRQFLYLWVAASASIVTCLCCSLIRLKWPLMTLIVNGLICIFVPNAICYIAWKKIPEFEYARMIAGKFVRKLVKK